MSTVWQENAARFASTPVSSIDMERRSAVRRAVELLAERPSRRGYALFVLVRSVERQARIAGAGSIPIEPLCACGERCLHGRGSGAR
ncbi:hypothetical protein [Nocardioides sp. InS609-2]|uniref:hypothetical protein n=1 Tax=Nocardioides sp. InS609-2 TaxID=2760705 RepID=UPI0020C0709F|nr:hypothetical protein [Nocardioides sp. InS609-2]